MIEGVLIDSLKNLFWILIGLVMPIIWQRWRRFRALRLASCVFPTKPGEDAKPVMHLRASFDRVEYGENPPTLRGYTHSGDMLGAIGIIQHFHNLPVDVEFDYFPEIRHGMKNVVLLGASSRSDVSREVATELYSRGIRVRGQNEHAHFCDPTGKQYRCEHLQIDGKHIVTRDAGVIFRKVADSGIEILMCGGIHTFGSQAAAEVALSAEFQKRVKRAKCKEFVQFLTVDVMTSGERAGLALMEQSIRWKDLPLVKL
jgi:hypothetical protein